MRTDSKVSGSVVLSICLGDVSDLRHSQKTIVDVIINNGLGEKNVSKDFLRSGSKDNVIKRGVNDKKRKCTTVLLSKLDAATVEQLKRGRVL